MADEFIIVDFLGGNTDEAKKLYKKIRLEIDKYIEKNHYEAVYTISAGLLESKDVADSSFQNLMKLSEFALSEARKCVTTLILLLHGSSRHSGRSPHLAGLIRQKNLITSIRQTCL